jgi:type I restriction enzyme, R subunit
MTTPEAQARHNIDSQLTASGWCVQSRTELNLYAGQGVAVREFLTDSGPADYILFVNRQAVGVVEAKPEGVTLSGVAEQTGDYATGLPPEIPHVSLPLPFQYESTGVETLFRDARDPEPRSRRVFTFHRPETLAEWLSQPDTLRARMEMMVLNHPLITDHLWPAQVEAIFKLERSFAEDRPRALIQMATGSGKTFTAVNFVYRLIKLAKAKRALFLVDRNNLGRQAFKEFDQFITPDDGRKFTELYNVQHLQSNALDDVSKVHITTIQRLYSMLRGEEEFDPGQEEISLWEVGPALEGQYPKEVQYNPRLPIDYYDVIITDECHRSIYNLWRQVLEYFDAFLIGLTATPSKQTFGFFNQNLVMEYNRARAVADGVNVDGQVYRIQTRISEQGSTIEKGWWVGRRDKRTRRQRWEQMDEDLTYSAAELDRRVVSPSQIRTILSAYQDSLSELFPGRDEVPKTLIFAKDDNHAEEIVHIAREVFGKGDEFCKKITYRASGDTEDLIAAFRNSYHPRIAVTVDMIATGTDVKPLEVLLFMRAVKSRVLFEQMLGRGTRIVSDTDFRAVTQSLQARKNYFVIVDAVGVTEQVLLDTQSIERNPSAPLKALLDAVATGSADEDVLSSLARRLGLMEKRLTENQRQEVERLLEVPDAPERFHSLGELANAMLDALDPDKILETAGEEAAQEVIDRARRSLTERALIPLAANPELRSFLLEREILIDETSIDEVMAAELDVDATERAWKLVDSFQGFIQEHKDEITALQILFSRPRAQRLEFRQVRELAERLRDHLHHSDPLYMTEQLWEAYQKLEKDRVRGAGERRILADLVSLVRHASLDEDLEPHPARVAKRYQAWLEGKEFTPQQRWWLDEIARHVGINVSIRMEDLNAYGFQRRGGEVAARRLFGVELPELLEEINTILST